MRFKKRRMSFRCLKCKNSFRVTLFLSMKDRNVFTVFGNNGNSPQVSFKTKCPNCNIDIQGIITIRKLWKSHVKVIK